MFSAYFSSPTPILFLSTSTHVIIHNLLRLSIFPILSVRHKMDYPTPTWRDWAFRRVWWIALGWCVAEAVVGIMQTYEQIGLYKDVMVEDDRVEDVVNAIHGKNFAVTGREEVGQRGGDTPTQPRAEQAGKGAELNGTSNGKIISADVSIQMQVEHDLNQLIALKEREELEEVYGAPVIVSSLPLLAIRRLNHPSL
jgi:hypothetical protein